MDNIIKTSFGINLRIMTMLKMYPPDNVNYFYTLQALIVFILSVPPVPIFGTLFFVFETDFTTAQLNDNAFLIAEMACQVTKYFPFIINGSRIKRCIHHFESLHLAINEKQQAILKRCCRTCRRNTKAYLIPISIGFIFFIFRPTFIKSQKFPGEVWLPYRLVDEPVLFPFIYLIIVCGVGYTCLACAAVDPLVAGLVYVGTGQLEILKDNLQHLDEYANIFLADKGHHNNFDKTSAMHRLIKQCVEHHNAILRFVAEYERCFSFSIFSQFMGGVLVICFCCLQLSKLEALTFNFTAMVTFFAVVLVQIYFYAYYGTVFFEESDSLAKAVYMGKWYEYEMDVKKSLVVLMERSKKPIIITVGIIFELSIRTFATILKRSYSLLAVLKNL